MVLAQFLRAVKTRPMTASGRSGRATKERRKVLCGVQAFARVVCLLVVSRIELLELLGDCPVDRCTRTVKFGYTRVTSLSKVPPSLRLAGFEPYPTQGDKATIPDSKAHDAHPPNRR